MQAGFAVWTSARLGLLYRTEDDGVSNCSTVPASGEAQGSNPGRPVLVGASGQLMPQSNYLHGATFEVHKHCQCWGFWELAAAPNHRLIASTKTGHRKSKEFRYNIPSSGENRHQHTNAPTHPKTSHARMHPSQHTNHTPLPTHHHPHTHTHTHTHNKRTEKRNQVRREDTGDHSNF